MSYIEDNLLKITQGFYKAPFVQKSLNFTISLLLCTSIHFNYFKVFSKYILEYKKNIFFNMYVLNSALIQIYLFFKYLFCLIFNNFTLLQL